MKVLILLVVILFSTCFSCDEGPELAKTKYLRIAQMSCAPNFELPSCDKRTKRLKNTIEVKSYDSLSHLLDKKIQFFKSISESNRAYRNEISILNKDIDSLNLSINRYSLNDESMYGISAALFLLSIAASFFTFLELVNFRSRKTYESQ